MDAKSNLYQIGLDNTFALGYLSTLPWLLGELVRRNSFRPIACVPKRYINVDVHLKTGTDR